MGSCVYESNPIPITVAECFDKLGLPLANNPGAPGDGAVYSLYPPNRPPYPYGPPALQNAALPSPNIPNADWRAISSVAPADSRLKFVLDQLILAVYPPRNQFCVPAGRPHTVDDILGDRTNDAVVTVSSQVDLGVPRVTPTQSHKFPALSHIPIEKDVSHWPWPNHANNANVEESPDVDKLVACWLANPSDRTCTSGLPATVVAGVSEAALGNNYAAPIRRIAINNPRVVDRLALRVPKGLELGKPFDLTVNIGSGGVPELHVVQSSETNTHRELTVSITRIEGQTVHLSVMPELFGATRLQVTGTYPDGGVATKEVTANVDYPSGPLAEFHADELAFAGIPLNPNKPLTLRLQPWAKWVSTGPRRVYLDTADVLYTIAPALGQPVIKLYPNGIIHALQKGTEAVTATFRSVQSQVRVRVVDPQQ
jgi:hypothetical protein